MHWTYCDGDLVSAEALAQAYGALTPSRKVHIDRFRRREDKVRSLVAGILVEKLLKEHCGMDRISLCRDDSGRPYLPDCDLSVSISHSGNRVACAVSQKPVGIDLEQLRPVDLNLCRHICVEEERKYVFGPIPEWEGGLCHDQEVLSRFFEIWTAKEAYFKRAGTGITNLKAVNVLPLPRQIHWLDNYILQIME